MLLYWCLVSDQVAVNIACAVFIKNFEGLATRAREHGSRRDLDQCVWTGVPVSTTYRFAKTCSYEEICSKKY